MNNDIKLPRSPKVKKTKFKGSPTNNLKVMKYLQNKYQEHCVIIPVIKKNKNEILEHTDVSLRWIQTKGKDGYFSIPKNYWEQFSKCSDKRFIIFPFGFTCRNNLGHAGICIYDKKTKSLERFEPYGKSKRDCTNPFNIDEKLKKLFQDNLGEDFIQNYYAPLDFMPTKSFQSLQEDESDFKKKVKGDPEGGFCAAWVAFLAELRLQNPNKDRKRLVILAVEKLDNSDRTMTSYIRGYSATLTT